MYIPITYISYICSVDITCNCYIYDTDKNPIKKNDRDKKYTHKTKKVHIKDMPTYIDELIFQNNMLCMVSSF